MITLDTLIAVLVANNQEEELTKALLVDSNNNHLSHAVGDSSADSESTMILTPEAEAAIAQAKASIGELLR